MERNETDAKRSAMAMTTNEPSFLSPEQIDRFWRDGWLIAPNAVSADQLNALQTDFDQWWDASREHEAPWDTDTVDGRPRFDMAAGHCAEQPMLRRVNDPIAISPAYLDVARNSAMVDGIADLIGPNVRFHHSKINAKLPGSDTAVKWHQDFAFTPHTNDDVVTALLMVTDVTKDNGALEVLSGSHTGPIHPIWHGGVFTGAVDEATEADAQARSAVALGPAGSVCYMHTRLLHGSAPNLSDLARTLFISVYSADDALPITPNPMPTTFSGDLVRGESTNQVRTIAYQMLRPELPATTSFFDQQDRAT